MNASLPGLTRVLAFGLCAALAAGCGGGGAGVATSTLTPQSQSPVLTTQSAGGTKGNVAFAIGLPPRPKARITPKYVSPSTQSLRILTDGSNPVVVNLTPSSPNCAPNLALPGAYICTASLAVPAGNHIFSVTTYDLIGATGNVLSTNSTATVIVKATGTTRVGIVLEGVVHDVVLTLATNPPAGAHATIALTANLEDADQNLIVGTAPYEHPVTLTTTDSVNGPLSRTRLESPLDTTGISVNYTGANVASITFSATASGLSAANVSNAVFTPGLARETILYQFPNAARGANPNSALLADAAGNLYGTTAGGGTANAGTVFKLTRSGEGYTQSVVHSFGSSAIDGKNPVDGVIADRSGALYGATSAGGYDPSTSSTSNYGTAYKLRPAGSGYTESLLYSFASGGACGTGFGTDACVPSGGLVFDPTGTLYGNTVYGGAFGEGAVFKLTPAGADYTESVVAFFDIYFDTGYNPQHTLLERNGDLYGVTTAGGNIGCSGCGGGAVFSLNKGNLYRFGGYANDGLSPSAVIADGSGALYGTTSGGGLGGFGTVFKLIPPAYTETILYNFKGGLDGAVPAASLIADSSGVLYGTTQQGGSSSAAGPGTVFKLTPTGGGYAETILYRFNQPGDGTSPVASLIADASGALYGTASNGGKGFGTVFKLTK